METEKKLSSDERINLYVIFMSRVKKIFVEKNKAYGQSWIAYRPKSFLERIWNVAVRIRTIQEKKQQMVADTIEDDFESIYNFSIIGLRIVERIETEQKLQINSSDEKIEKSYESSQENCLALFKKKDHDYDGAWMGMSVSGIVDEILGRMLRGYSIENGKEAYNQVDYLKLLKEIFMDVANYAAFANILTKDFKIDPMK